MHRLTRGKRLVDMVTTATSINEVAVLDEKTGEFLQEPVCLNSREPSDVTDDETFCGFSDVESVIPSDPEFVADEDTIITDSSEVEEILNERCGTLTRKRKSNNRKKERMSKGKAEKSEWKRIKNSEARLKGEQYVGFQKDQDGKYQQTLVRPAKGLQEACNGHSKIQHGGPRQQYECEKLSENNRQSMFDKFWNVQSWDARKVYVRNLVGVSTPQYRRSFSNNESSRKGTSFKYFLMLRSDNNVQRIHVCKVMFMRTLSIGSRQLRNWLTENLLKNTEPVLAPIQPQIRNDESEETNSIVEFFDKLPKVESHYCRSSTKKLYLEPVWNTITGDLYAEYLKFCSTHSKKKYCSASFSRKFHELNFFIYKPRKDQCNTCIAFRNGNVAADEYANHLQKKERSRKEKSKDKENTGADTAVYTMDMQAVLLCPRMQASATYYKTKLKVHNYTIYNLITKEDN
ncbi:unnamed protein product [Parnassius mnemosyne]|uniref:Uncharacterized protein n=1 Tax=Parnassius mnemosyne TaxID=213953 RepID=A0AAV1LLF7_9NEOP